MIIAIVGLLAAIFLAQLFPGFMRGVVYLILGVCAFALIVNLQH